MQTQSISSVEEICRTRRLLCNEPSYWSTTSKYFLEMARTYSIEFKSQPVLCRRFLPWMDLSVSASGDVDIWDPVSPGVEHLDRRFREVLDLVDGTEEDLQDRNSWYCRDVSFGLVSWWPLSIRKRAFDSLGPFKVIIDCENPGVRINGF